MVKGDGRQRTLETREQGRILVEYVLLVVLMVGIVMTTTLFLGLTIRDLYDRTEAALFPTASSDSQGNQGNGRGNQGNGRWNGSGNQDNGSDQGDGDGNERGNQGKRCR